MRAQLHNKEIAMADAATPDVRKAGTWVIVWGVLLIVAGILAIMQPPIAALAFELLLGWLFVFAGIVQIVYAFQQRGTGRLRLEDPVRRSSRSCWASSCWCGRSPASRPSRF